MTRTANPAEVARFRTVLADRLGWTFGDDDAAQLARVLTRRAARLRVAHRDYLEQLAAGGGRAEQAALAEELTITETYFYRYAEQFRALAEMVLPRLLRARAGQRRLRLLSVGCSSGEEAYTLAITVREVFPDTSWDVSVLGVDANPAALRRAVAGRYSAWSLRDTPDAVRQRWFRPADGGFEVDPDLRTFTHFRRHNVVDDGIVWRGDSYDVVFCRNLLMYLTPAAGRQLILRMTRALAPEGHLFLGHTDTLGSRPEGLEPQHTHGSFYYRRPPEPAQPAIHPAAGRPPEDRPPEDRGSESRGPESRGPVVPPAARAAEMPVPRPPRGAEPPAARRADGTGIDPAVRGHALGLLRGEQFADALAVVEDGMPDRPRSADLLLHGVVLAQTGRLDAAEIAVRRALDADGLCADAHHLLAVCLEDGAAVEVSIGHYRLAAYLDPRFAMPRLRLGLLARRRRDHHTARAELEFASTLLRFETQERIVLFGGGFGRTSLLALCRAELDACEVRR
jgi:chemotaxis protein methyltransferase CheR